MRLKNRGVISASVLNIALGCPDFLMRQWFSGWTALNATSDRPASHAAPTIAHMVHPDTERDVHDALSDMTVRVGATTYARQNEAVAAREDLLPILSRIWVPTLVARGAKDGIKTRFVLRFRVKLLPISRHRDQMVRGHGDSYFRPYPKS